MNKFFEFCDNLIVRFGEFICDALGIDVDELIDGVDYDNID